MYVKKKDACNEMISLRGHHLICLHFFQGEGYNKDFVDNLTKVIKDAELGTRIIITEGADDVCAACPHLDNGRCAHKPDSEKEIRILDEMALNLLALKPYQSVRWHDAKGLTMSIPQDQLSQFCKDCDWEKLCVKLKNKEEGYQVFT